jgi:hypothetical protein
MDVTENLLLNEVLGQWAIDTDNLRRRVAALGDAPGVEVLTGIENDLGALSKAITRVHNGLHRELFRKVEAPF